MTIYDLLYVMDNMNFNVIIQNDAKIDDEDEGILFEGEVYEFKETATYDRVQDYEVTDLFTLSDGRMYICFCEEEE